MLLLTFDDMMSPTVYYMCMTSCEVIVLVVKSNLDRSDTVAYKVQRHIHSASLITGIAFTFISWNVRVYVFFLERLDLSQADVYQ